MKLSAGQVYAAVETIKRLESTKLPLKGKYGISRLASKLAPEYTVIETQRNDLIRKHGEEKDGQISVPNGNMPAFFADLNILLVQEIEVDCPQVKLDDLGNAETDVDLTPLLPFISEGENAVT